MSVLDTVISGGLAFYWAELFEGNIIIFQERIITRWPAELFSTKKLKLVNQNKLDNTILMKIYKAHIHKHRCISNFDYIWFGILCTKRTKELLCYYALLKGTLALVVDEG